MTTAPNPPGAAAACGGPLKFLVWGHGGWLGGQLSATLERLGHAAVPAASRADDEEAVAKELAAVRPDRAVSLVGRTRGPGCGTIDYLEGKGRLRENVRDNLWAPLVLGQRCAAAGVHLTYMGTGCIFHYTPVPGFDGRDGSNGDAASGSAAGTAAAEDERHALGSGVGFAGDAKPNFFGSSYSVVKGFTDRAMHLLFEGSALNVRIRMPITADASPFNFITKIANYEKVIDIPNSVTVLPELLPLMVDMAVRKETGTVNMTNPGAVSHNQVLELYRRHVDPAFSWANFTPAEQDRVLAAGRSNNLLDTSRLERQYPNVRPALAAVEAVCVEMARSCPDGVKKRK